jgi:hypothetical protein
MKLIPRGTASKTEIIKFQEALGFEPGSDYLKFLEDNNGWLIEDGFIDVKDLSQTIKLDILFGIGLKVETSNLIFWQNEMKDDLPAESVIIGSDPGGGLLLLVKNQGVFYWDHSWFFEQSNEEANTYFIAKTFTEFISKIHS